LGRRSAVRSSRSAATSRAPWYTVTTIDRDRKELLRTLLEEVIIAVEVAEFRARLTLRWRGELLSEPDVPLPCSGLAPIRTDEETVTLLQRFRQKNMGQGQK
jgi:hypothetical protein